MPERHVVFYECQDVEHYPAFDRVEALRDINDLDEEDWRVADYDTELGVIVDRVGNAQRTSRLRFLRIRADVPYVLSAARQLSLVQVDEDERISEFTYVTLWPDGFMAAVSSRDAPGHKRLARYFLETSGQRTHIVNLFEPDIVERLRELRRNGLRNVKVKVQTSNLEQIQADRHARGFSGIFNAGRDAEAATIGVELGVGRPRRGRLSDDIAASAEELAQMGDLLESMIVRGRDDDGVVQEINMKRERIRAPVDIEATATTADIYQLMRQARRTVERRIGSLDRAARGT